MKTRKQLKEMTKDALITALLAANNEAGRERRLRKEESDSHLKTIMNLQARCLTQTNQRGRAHERIAALTHIVNGFKITETMEQRSQCFDIRNGDVMRRIAELFGPSEIVLPSGRRQEVPLVAILVCPKCGRITRLSNGPSGERICDKCLLETEWPWDGEVFWRVNENGLVEGLCRGKYIKPE